MGPLKNEAGEVRASTGTARHYGYAMQIFNTVKDTLRRRGINDSTYKKQFVYY